MPDWLLVAIALAPLVGILSGVIWKQLNDKITAHKEHCDEEIEKLWNQIGRDSSSGMRKLVHNSVPMGAHVSLETRVHMLETDKRGDR